MDEIVGVKEASRAISSAQNFRSYPKYKFSGIEWLGKIPEEWALSRIKGITKFIGGGTPSKENIDFWNGDILWVSPKDMKVAVVVDTEDKITSAALENSATNIIPSGSVLIVVRSGILIHSIPVAIAGKELTLNQDLKALVPKLGLTSKYLFFMISGLQKTFLNLWKKDGATVESLELELIGNTEVSLPSTKEQLKIVSFLDRKTAEIDALVAKKELLIELLQQKRSALITQAVTKGLDPNAKMKDSGVEWLGEVPEHWPIKKLKQVAQVRGGVAKGRDLQGQVKISVPYLRVANVQDGYLDLNDVSEIEILPNELKRFQLIAGDVLMNEGGDFDKLGRGCIWDDSISPCVHQNHVFSVRPKSISSEWLAAYTATSQAKFYFMSRAKQSTNLASISLSNLQELALCVPSEGEQKAILNFVASEQKKLEDLLQESQRAIALLKEYRSALISAAVTGKIDVRNEVVESN